MSCFLLSVLFISPMNIQASSIQPPLKKRIIKAKKISRVTLQEKIGQMLIVSFHGTSPSDHSVKRLKTQMQKGLVSGCIYFKENIQNKNQYLSLSTFLTQSKSKYKLLFAADLEGGKVNRFKSIEGLSEDFFLSPLAIAQKYKNTSFEKYDYGQIKNYYLEIAAKIKDLKINYNFAPTVDVHDSECPVIGKFGRSFSKSSAEVTAFARIFIQAMQQNNILCCLKHYPGHGRSKGDSHIGFVDVTAFHRNDELIPYQILTSPNHNTTVDSIMLSHVVHKRIDSLNPTSLSPIHVSNIRKHYDGVLVSDDMIMGAILKRNPDWRKALADGIVQAINAGVNIIIISEMPYSTKDNKKYPAIKNLVDFFHRTVQKAIKDKKIDIQRIDDSFTRIINMKKRLP